MTPILSRRRFTSALSLASAATLLPRAAFAGARQEVFTNGSLGAYTQGLMTMSHFHAMLGTLFMAFLDEHSVSYMHLHQVEQHKQPAHHHATSSFYARFKTDGKVLPQGSYLIDHGRLGRFAAFLVPGQLADGTPTASATFSSQSEAILN